MTVPNFCAACGARLNDNEIGFCAGKACQDYARKRTIESLGLPLGVAGTKLHLIAALNDDLINGQHSNTLRERLENLRNEVARYPYDECPKLWAQRAQMLGTSVASGTPTTLQSDGVNLKAERVASNPLASAAKLKERRFANGDRVRVRKRHGADTGNIDIRTKVGTVILSAPESPYVRVLLDDPACARQCVDRAWILRHDELLPESKIEANSMYGEMHDDRIDSSRVAFDAQVRVNQTFKDNDPDRIAEVFRRDLLRAALARRAEGPTLAVVAAKIAAHPQHVGIARVDLQADTDDAVTYALRPGSRVKVLPDDPEVEYVVVPRARRPVDKFDVEDAIRTKTVKRKHIEIAADEQLNRAVRALGMGLARLVWNVHDQSRSESDDAFRTRVLNHMPLERGSEFHNRSHWSNQSGIAVSNRVAGCFDAASGEHLRKVAKLNGVLPKENESDDDLRRRMYKLLED